MWVQKYELIGIQSLSVANKNSTETNIFAFSFGFSHDLLYLRHRYV